MFNPTAIEQLVKEEIASQVNDQVVAVLTSDEWRRPLEHRILKTTQERILSKFSNSESMPEIIEVVKDSVANLFKQGVIPGIDQFVKQDEIAKAIDLAVTQIIDSAVEQFGQDPVWLEKIERMINQAVVQRTVSALGQIDLTPIIQQRTDENMARFKQDILTQFSSTGIDDQATKCQLTIMDEVTVVENQLTTRELEVVDTAVINNLAVKGSINVNNQSWQTLADAISQKTLAKITTDWQDSLVQAVRKQIIESGINLTSVTVDDQPLIAGNTLASTITESRLQSVGHLKELTVRGELHANNTMSVLNRRVGVNTREPEMALAVWDEEVSITAGKFKAQQGWIGTSRNTGLAIGVNRTPQIEIDIDGLTTVKQLRVGLHRISHATQVPGYAGTRGDIVLNTNLGADRVFAWMCLGAHKWQALKSAE